MNKLVGYRNKQCDNECDKSSGGIKTAKIILDIAKTFD